MKKIIAAFLVCLLLISSMPLVYAASANVSVKADATTAAVGKEVTVSITYSSDVGIGSIDASVQYDSSILEYVSSNGAVNGGAGVLKISYFAVSATADKTYTVQLKFKTKAVGSSAVSVSTNLICDDADQSLGTPSGSTKVNVQNPKLSDNADLKSLYISAGSLSPAFSAKVTSYEIVIPNAVTVLTVSATAADGNAVIAVEGSKNMKVGKNTRVIKVTAPNGTVKAYTLNITRQEATGNEGGEVSGEPETETNEAAEVTVGEDTLYIATDFKDVTLPMGYEQVPFTVNEKEFPSAQDKNRNIVLLYLTNKDGENGAFYVYNTTNMTFSAFNYATVSAGVYAFVTPDNTQGVPEGFTQMFIQINEQTVSAFSFPQAEMAEYFLVYALSPQGNKGWYVYDSKEGTLQRFTNASQIAPVVEEQPLEESDENVGFFGKIKDVYQNLLNRFGGLRLALLAVGAVILIAASVVLIVLLAKRPRGYKH